MTSEAVRVFISYSRADATFVDQLEADLRAWGFITWVDRHRLQGGQMWAQEIANAITQSDCFLLVLSPSTAESKFVPQELETAVRLGKRRLSVLLKQYQTRPWLAPAEALEFENFEHFRDPATYRVSLTKLLYAIQDPTLGLNRSDDELYNDTLSLRASDPERAVIILQFIVLRSPSYFGGQAKQDLVELETRLYASRVARLRAQALDARKQGLYGVEAASLELLLALGNGDEQAVAWAKEYLPIAQQNRGMLGLYGIVQDQLAAGHLDTAREVLQNLWKQAPYFGDPAGIAPDLGLALPPSYLQDKAALEARHFQEACELLRPAVRDTEPTRYSSAMDVRERDRRARDRLLSSLRALGYDLPNPDAGERVETIDKARDRYLAIEASANDRKQQGATYDIGCVLIVLGGLAVCWLGILVLWVLYDIWVHWGSPAGPLYWGVQDVPWVILLWAVSATIAFVVTKKYLRLPTVLDLERQAAAARSEAQTAFEQWRHMAEQVYEERMAAIKRQTDAPYHGS